MSVMNKVVLTLLFLAPHFAKSQHVPSFEDVISLRSIGGIVLSPDGKNIAYTVQTTDWVDNRFDNEIWLSKNGQTPFQMTNTKGGNSSNPSFSPDGKWLAFLSERGSKTQIFVINLSGGEAQAATNEGENIESFEWHPSGKSFILVKEEEEKKEKKEREKRYGGFETDDKDFTLSHLYQVDFNPDLLNPREHPCYETVDSLKIKAGCIDLPKATQLTKGSMTVVSFLTSPDGNKVAFTHQPDPLINSSVKTDISVLDLKTKTSSLVVNNPSSDDLKDWSPDSNELLYTSSVDDSTSNFYKNSKLFAVNLVSRTTRQLAKDLDENLGNLSWRPTGIFSAIWSKTKRPLYKIDPTTGSYQKVITVPEQIFSISLSKSGDVIAFSGRNGDQLNELFVSPVSTPKPEKITDMTSQTSDWKVAQSEVISWKSKDGSVIEGVLHKPKDYDAGKKYPLMVVIHGGPTGIDTPTPVPSYVYPILQWLDKGCLVLRPNYRGSAGYGEKFRSLNVKNLGVGDAWDVLSGVDFLDKKGLIDKARMGCMGWSQGGYISAFLTTNTNQFKAISVGAGISNWMTYYVNTDIHPFTRQYLQATPWSNEAIYRKTSPITNINKASTPTLIQHGEFDKRVPIANAYELLQGLRDNHVPSELIVYKGFGHGITKPKERLAATWHNWQWFNKYIWNENIDLPLKTGK